MYLGHQDDDQPFQLGSPYLLPYELLQGFGGLKIQLKNRG